VIADRSTAVLAHGLGGSTDLPVPLSFALIGAAWALTFTFAVVALAWRRPRFDPDRPGRPLPRCVTTFADAPVTRWVVAIAALAFAVWVVVAGFVGPQDADNPLPGVFYVLLWAGLMARSLIPIVIGYVFAHYLTYLVERGQQTVFLLLGLHDAQVHYVLSMHPPVLATIKVGCVVGGHIAAVIAAHDKALRLLPAGHQLTGQLAMMLVMVGYTFTGLYLLFGG
jgi:hypothetical protein